ncbi:MULTISPECIES: hypothetical protein [unclassified Brevundimonas]|uniref:hypothetical protein n=1 Tax=unclassified Brevundimonas TaxID=2622653 RepID=UPI0025BD6026|nr:MULTISPECIES: hypothetical protein [unclassified Brevundimonas]
MARDIESLVLTMSADIRRMEKSLAQGQRTFDKTADAIERRQRQLDKNLANLGREAGNFARPVQLAATVALGAITAMSYQAARRAEAVSGAFEQTFRDMPKEAALAASGIATEFGRLETDIKDNFTQLRSVLTALGVDAQQSLSIVDQLQRRSLDIAAFRDVSDADAFRAVISGITGETEPLKRFGIVVNETAVKAELLALGFKGNATNASEAAKSIARANIIMRQSAEAQGQVAREADGLAEKEKRATVAFQEQAEMFGDQFLPIAGEVLTWATDALKAFNDLPSGVQIAGLSLLGLVAAAGPIAMVITGLSNLVKAAVAARVAIAGIGATSAGAGVAAGAGAVAGAAARALPVVAAGSAVISLGGDTNQKALQGQERVNAQLREEARVRQSIARLTREGNVAEAQRQQAYLQRVETSRKAGQSALASAAPTAAATEAQKAATEIQSALGGFTLSSDQQAPVGGAGASGAGRAKAEAAAAARRAEAQEALSLQRAIDIARVSGNEASIKAAEERQTLVQMTAQYEAAGYTDARARAIEHLSYINAAEMAAEEREKAEKQIDDILEGRRRQMERDADYAQLLNDQLMDRLGYEAELARISGADGAIKNAERRLFIEERTLEILRLKLAASEAEARAMAGGEFDTLAAAEDGRTIASNIVSVLRSDNIWEEAGRRFKDAAWDGVEDLLSSLFSQMGKGAGSGGANWLSAFASMFTGGRKAATGRSATAGFPVLIGERRPEVFVPNTSGTIIPSVNAAMSRVQQAGARPQELRVSIDLDGANGDEAIRQIAYEAAARGTLTAIAANRAEQHTAGRRARQRFV